MAPFHQLINETIEKYRDAGGAGLSLLESRLELAVLELQEQKIWALRALILVTMASLLLFLALITLAAAVILYVPDTRRPMAALITAGVYALASLAGFLKLKSVLRRTPSPLVQTIAEIKEDLKCF